MADKEKSSKVAKLIDTFLMDNFSREFSYIKLTIFEYVYILRLIRIGDFYKVVITIFFLF